jgi:hypothetical protein
MSSDKHISVRTASPDLSFDDLAALNQDLFASEAGELVSRILAGTHDIVRLIDGKLHFVDADEIEYVLKDDPEAPAPDDCYQTCVNVWACWSLEASQVLANHMVAGRLILEFQPEGGWSSYFHELVPGKAQKYDPF